MSDLSDLMAKDPLLCTKEDVDAIIEYHTKNGQAYAAGLKTVKTRAKANNGEPKPALGDLDVQL